MEDYIINIIEIFVSTRNGTDSAREYFIEPPGFISHGFNYLINYQPFILETANTYWLGF